MKINAKFKTSGIYAIEHIPSNRMYIGSSHNMAVRIAQHLNHLNSDKHHSKYLQNAWNKYPEDEFHAIVLEVVTSQSKLVEREQFWIDNYNSYRIGFNGRPTANNMFGMEWSESTNRKRRESNKKTWSDPILREKLSQKFTGTHRGNWTDKSKNIVRQKMKAFILENPSHLKKMHAALARPDAQKRRLEGITKSLQDPEVRSARIRQLSKASASPDRLKALRLAYFEKYNRNSGECDTPEELDELCSKLYGEGLTARAIGREIGMAHKSVSARLRRMGVHIKRHPNKGSKVVGSKLSEANVKLIKQCIKEGNSIAEIAKMFSVSNATIYDIASGRTWKDVAG
jgi:group I intron endonuclease